MKSFQESGGTTLSTNWDEVGKGKVEVQPPQGSEWKRWGQTFNCPLEVDPCHSCILSILKYFTYTRYTNLTHFYLEIDACETYVYKT